MITALPSLRALPRERILNPGALGTTVSDLLAVLIGTGVSGVPAQVLARKIEPLVISGHASYQLLSSVPGVGPAKASRVLAGLALAPSLEQQRSQILNSPERIFQACSDLLQEKQEHLAVFFLTTRSTILERQIVSLGTLSASIVHPREVFRAAIVSNASHIVIAHNHPSGDATPSTADLDVTKTLARAGQQLGIELIDHVICARSGYTSLKVVAPEVFW